MMTIYLDPLLLGYVGGLLMLPALLILWGIWYAADRRYRETSALHREQLARVRKALDKEG